MYLHTLRRHRHWNVQIDRYDTTTRTEQIQDRQQNKDFQTNQISNNKDKSAVTKKKLISNSVTKLKKKYNKMYQYTSTYKNKQNVFQVYSSFEQTFIKRVLVVRRKITYITN